MTKRRFYILTLLGVIGIILLYYFSPSLHRVKNKSTDGYSVETFKYADGWGYQICTQEKAIIVQPFIPCLIGEKPFPDEESALKIGELVLSKIRNNDDPSITIEELDKTVRIEYN